MADQPADGHLTTKYVFLDTETFRHEKLDWSGKRFSKLVELAREGHVTLVTTSITKREIRAQAEELLEEARKAVAKSRSVLSQLGHAEAVSTVIDTGASEKLNEAFEAFLVAAGAVEIPITATTDELFDSYFARQPPFSTKKKHEFRDAAVIRSLRNWCEKHSAKVYVVSGDSDMKDCCPDGGPLLYSASIGDLLTTAIVSKEFHDALEEAISASEYATERLAEYVKEEEVDAVRRSDFDRDTTASGKVSRIDGVYVFSVEILDRQDQRLVCEVGFEAEVVIDLEVETMGWHDPRDYQPSYHYSGEITVQRNFYAEVIISMFDPRDPAAIEFESIYVSSSPIELVSSEFPHRRGW